MTKGVVGIFRVLRAMRAFERAHLPFLRSSEDRELVAEIGYCQAAGKPLTVKRALLLDGRSVATAQRRLRRLRQLGLVREYRAPHDRRAMCLRLSPKVLRVYARYAKALPVLAEELPVSLE